MAGDDTRPFAFKRFAIEQDRCAMKVGIDGVLLGAWAAIGNSSKALDIGTGSGLIALMLAQRSPDLWVDAVEIDQRAALQAGENFTSSPFSERLRILPQSIQEYTAQHSGGSYDLIISNPPFFTGGVLSENQERASVRHTVKLPHQDLLRSVQQLLHPAGRFCLILPWIEGLRFQELAASYQLWTTARALVAPRPGRPVNRILLQLEKRNKPLVETELTIYGGEESSEWSEDYKALTQEFYLHM